MKALMEKLMRALFGGPNEGPPGREPGKDVRVAPPAAAPAPVRAAVERKGRQQDETLERMRDAVEVIKRQRPGGHVGHAPSEGHTRR